MGANISTELSVLATQIRTAHQAVGLATQSMLAHALAAGDALIAAKPLVRHGEWEHWLKRNCDLSLRTAYVYAQLARHRPELEAKLQHAAVFSLRGALKLIGQSTATDGSSSKGQSKSATTLSTLAWSEATPLDGIGLASFLAAIPPTWQAEIERRVLGLHKAETKAEKPEDKVNLKLAKALKQLLSLQKVHRGKGGLAPGTAPCLNVIIDLLGRDGLDLNDLVELLVGQAAKAA